MRENLLKKKIQNGESAIGTFVKLTDPAVPELLALAGLKTEHVLPVASDQFGSPTSANDLARLLLELMDTNEYGTYHITAKGTCSRYEFAKEILRLTDHDVTIQPVPTKESEFSSVRPAYAVLDNFILRILNMQEMPEWRESLKIFLKENYGGTRDE